MIEASLAAQPRHVCFNHPAREAAAHCVSCGRPFCRECVTPVERRMHCLACHKTKTEVKAKPGRDMFLLSVTAQAVLGVVGLWFTAYFFGKVLLVLPSSFHEGTVWTKFMP